MDSIVAVECETGMRLTEEQIEQQLAEADGWHRDGGKWITRKYRFKQFMDGIAFVNEVAQTAERMNHHPMISIDYKMITLRLTTWHDGGLTALDFQSAEAYNYLFEKY